MDNKLLSRSLMGLGEGGLYKQTVDIKFHCVLEPYIIEKETLHDSETMNCNL